MDTIDKASRYFNITFAQQFNYDEGTYHFKLPPPTAKAFSDKYNQALINIKRVCVNDGGAFRAGWQDVGGSYIHDEIQMRLDTNLPTSNSLVISHATTSNKGGISTAHTQRFGKTMNFTYNRIPIHSTQIIDGATYGGAWGVECLNNEAITLPTQTLAGGGGTASVKVHYCSGGWIFDNPNSIFDEGILCGVPFGNNIEFTFKNLALDKTAIMGGQNAGGAGADCGSFFVEMEFYLLNNDGSR